MEPNSEPHDQNKQDGCSEKGCITVDSPALVANLSGHADVGSGARHQAVAQPQHEALMRIKACCAKTGETGRNLPYTTLGESELPAKSKQQGFHPGVRGLNVGAGPGGWS